MKLYKDKNIEFRYDINGDVLIVRFLNPHPIFMETAQFTGAIELVNAKRLLVDLSNVQSFEADAKDLLTEDLTKQLIGHGVRKLAIIKSSEPKVTEMFLDVIMQNKPPKLKVKVFTSTEDALTWLKDPYSKD